MNHKRHKPKSQRGHCHLCKGYKDVGNSKSGLDKQGLIEREKEVENKSLEHDHN